MSMLVVSYYYINSSKRRIGDTQLEALGQSIVGSAESIFYEGQPSQITITIYVPDNVDFIEVTDYAIVINSTTDAGTSSRAFISDVLLDSDSGILATEGTHKLLIKASSDRVYIENA